jgi:dTDP-4-dehydrorhamnose reductase
MDRKRLLVIGAKGFLGTHAVQAALSTGDYQVIRGDRSSSGLEGSEELDVSDAATVNRVFQNRRPDLVLLLAAISDIDKCEASPNEAFATNARGAEHVANACAQSNARLLFTSTAAVFNGSKHGYREEDIATPLSVYGKTKLSAENAIKGLLPSAVIVRFALVLGFAQRMGTNAMLDSVIARWKAGEPVFFSTREERNPIDAPLLSRIMIGMLADRAMSGVYHAGSLDSISRYELGLRLAARTRASPELVCPQKDPVPGRAPRGEHHFLLTDKLRSVCQFEIGSCDQVIERCFS